MKRLVVFLALAAIPLASSADLHPNNARGFDPEKVYQLGDVDSVNVFNGNLIVTIPIGQTYKVSDHLSWRLTLVYNGNPWNYRMTTTTEAIPSRFANAGLGWQLSLGELVGPRDTLSPDPREAWVYASPDGSERSFARSLHEEENGTSYEAPASPNAYDVVGYTTDSSYLRLVRGVPEQAGGSGTAVLYKAVYWLDFPDGTRHTFKSEPYDVGQGGSPVYQSELSLTYRLTKMEDRFGNSVTIDYFDSADPEQTPSTWTIKENVLGQSAIRTHTVLLGRSFVQFNGGTHARPFVKTVRLAAFGGRTLEYRLEHVDKTISVPCSQSDLAQTTTAKVLTSVKAFDGASLEPLQSYSMQHVELESGGCSQKAGHLTRLTLPTGGTIEYDADNRLFPSGNESTIKDRNVSPKDVSVAVKTRTLVNKDGSRFTTTYTPYFHTPGYFQRENGSYRQVNRQMTVEVKNPLGQVTHHHFMVWLPIAGTDNCFTGVSREYGLPFLRTTGTADADLLRSTEVYGASCAFQMSADPCPRPVCVSGTTLQPLQRTSVKYDLDTEDQNKAGVNSRLSASRTRFGPDNSDCSGCYTETRLTDFDGLGHYRTESKSSDYPGSVSHVATTHFNANPNAGSYVPNGSRSPSTYMLGSGERWLLNLYDEIKSTEGSNSIVERMCFDRTTGFLLRRRQLAGTSEAPIDLLAVFSHIGGNVVGEAYYGGDETPLPGMTDFCTGSLPSPAYRIVHTYDAGTRQSSRYVGVDFDSLNLTIDSGTGLPRESRDTAGVVTTYVYDVLGRLTRVDPDGTARTDYQYSLTPPSVTAKTMGTGSDPLKEQNFYFDGFGRLVQTRLKVPSGQWAAIQTKYDALGRKESVSVPVEVSTGGYGLLIGPAVTAYAYDALGRTTNITAPDGSPARAEYDGGRRKRLIKKMFVDGQHREVSTAETYDQMGRLIKVSEDNAGVVDTGADGTYAYDAAGRLIKATVGSQPDRTFQYDGRGFLGSESHPESGVTTYKYDARGHVKRKDTQLTSLTFTWDPAERLQYVKSGSSTLKEFKYDRANSGTGTQTDYSMGKLDYAIRANYVPVLSGDNAVKETFVYKGPDGRLSEKKTEAGGQSFVQRYGYDDLGSVASITYPECAGCGSGPARTIENTYAQGVLTGVKNYGTIDYHIDGSVKSVQHAGVPGYNAPLDVQAEDPHGMARPAQITVSGFCADYAITLQPKDAAISKNDSVTLTVSAPGSLSYQWYDGTGAPISGATSASLKVTPAATSKYWVRASNGSCSVDSRTSQVTVAGTCSTVPTAIVSGSTTISAGGEATVFVALTGAGPWIVKWFDGTTTTTREYVAASAEFSVAPTSTRSYSVTSVTDTNGCTGTSSGSATVTVSAGSCSQPSATISTFNTPVILGVDRDAHAPAGGAAYSWEIVGGLGQIISGQNDRTVRFRAVGCPPSTGANLTLRVTVTAACGATNSSSRVVFVSPPVAYVSRTTNPTDWGTVGPFNPGAEATFWTTFFGPEPYSVTWSDGSQTWSRSGITDSNTQNGVPVARTVTIRAIAFNANGCTGITDGWVTAEVLCPTADATITAPSSVDAGSIATAAVPATSGNSYAWTITNGTIVSGASTPTVTYRAGCSGVVTLSATVTAGCGTKTGSYSSAIVPVSATVSGSAEIQQGGSSTIEAALSGSGPWTVTWSDGVVQNNVTDSRTTREVSPQGTTIYSVTSVSNEFACSGGGGGSAVITVIPAAPTLVTASATGPSQVAVTWVFSGSADTFVVEWRGATTQGTYEVPGTQRSFSHSNLVWNAAYLYRVRAVKAGTSSPLSAPDVASTRVFSDVIVANVTYIRAVHFLELRSAVDAIRLLVPGMAPAVYSDPVTMGGPIMRSHIEQLRSALNDARGALELPLLTFTDWPLPVAAVVKATHVSELRGGVQ